MGEGSTRVELPPIEELKRFSAIKEAKKDLAFLASLLQRTVPDAAAAVAKLREAYAALLALESKRVVR